MMDKDIQSSIRNQDLLVKRREQIVMTATKLFLSQGFERTSVREIAQACGMTVGGLYRYVGSKDDILWLTTRIGDFAGENLMDRLRGRVEGLKPVEALRVSIDLYFRTVEQFQDLYNFHNHIVWTASRDFRRSIFDREIQKVVYFTQLLDEGVRSGAFVIEDTRLTAHNIILAGNAWANRRWFLHRNYTLEDYIERETNILLSAIQPWPMGERNLGNIDASCSPDVPGNQESVQGTSGQEARAAKESTEESQVSPILADGVVNRHANPGKERGRPLQRASPCEGQ